jgi:DNA-binding NtrC family response regulator
VLHGAELAPALERREIDVGSFEALAPLLERARRAQPRVCVVGPVLEAAAQAVKTMRREMPFTDVVAWMPRGPAARVRETLLAGARDVVLDDAPEAVVEAVCSILEEQKLLPLVLEHEDRDKAAWRFEGLVSRSRTMWEIFETCARTAQTDATVLILGETGTGKELIARAIHVRSHRKGRFVALNCGGVPETLIDSELFGHVEGAFTGAVGAREGLFRHGQGGTLFLDEIGNLPISAQNRLLRALQEGEIRPVGGQEEIPIDVRMIAATSAPLDTSVEQGEFREDLLYRLDVIRLIVPPLRERPEDIVFLFGHFAQQLADHYKLQRPPVTDDFLDALQSYEWPGNVRELENFTERLLLTETGERLTGTHFRQLMRTYRGREEEPAPDGAPASAPGTPVSSRADATGLRGAVVDTDRPLSEVLEAATEDVERAYLESALQENGGRIARTAAQAGISRRTLLRKLRRYGIDKSAFRD